MATIFFTCLQCGEYLKSSHQFVAKEVSVHMCQNKFDLVNFQKGIDLLQEEKKLKSVTLPPPPPPPMPSRPLYMASKHTIGITRGNKGKTEKY